MHPDEEVEARAFQIYCEFIRWGIGTHKMVEDEFGNCMPETTEQCCTRRWLGAFESVREEFRAEARAEGYGK